MSLPLKASVCGKYDMPSRRPYERIAEGLISACRKHVVAATGSSPFKVGDNQRPKRTMSGVRKPSPESSVPGENLTGGSRRNQLRRGHGSPPVLSEVPHELSIPMRTPKSANGPRSNSFRPDSPLTTTSNRGRKTQSSLSPHRTWSVPDASSKPQLNLHNIGSAFGQTATNDTFACQIEKNHKLFEKNHKFYAIQAVENGNPA